MTEQVDINQFIRKASDVTASLGKIVTIAGDAGVGKTTIAHRCFPKPIFIPIERGLLSIPDADVFQEPTCTSDVLHFLDFIKAAREAGTFQFQTVVLDSISELETKATREVCAKHGVDSLGEIKGYGIGYSEVGTIHRAVREKCDALIRLGLHVVAISHTVTREIAPPDAVPYSRYELQVGGAGSKQWLNQVDGVFHVRNATNMVEMGSAKHKVAQAIKNQRVIDMVAKPSNMAKNRFRVQHDVIFTFDPETGEFNNPLAPIMGFDMGA